MDALFHEKYKMAILIKKQEDYIYYNSLIWHILSAFCLVNAPGHVHLALCKSERSYGFTERKLFLKIRTGKISGLDTVTSVLQGVLAKGNS